MPDLIPWEYGGHTFHVAATMSDAAKDRACATLLSEWERRKPGINVSLAKDSAIIPKVNPPRSKQSPLEGVPQASVMILCSICSLPVQRTGNRGRPRKTHQACAESRPSQSEECAE